MITKSSTYAMVLVWALDVFKCIYSHPCQAHEVVVQRKLRRGRS